MAQRSVDIPEKILALQEHTSMEQDSDDADANSSNAENSDSDSTNTDDLEGLGERIDKYYAKNGSMYRLKLDEECIPSALYPMIRRDMGKHSRYTVRYPKKPKNGPIEIHSGCDDGSEIMDWYWKVVQSAKDARLKMPASHVLCFPIVNDEMKKNLQIFRKQVTQKCGQARGFRSELFQKPGRLHLAIGMLSMLNKAEISRGTTEFKEYFSESLRKLLKGPLTCRVKGLEIVTDSASKADVVYGIVEGPSGVIQDVANKVYRRFAKSRPSLLHKQSDHSDGVKLRVVFMSNQFGQGEGKKKSFDARQILREFGDFDFGQVELKQVNMSRTSANGSYKATNVFVLGHTAAISNTAMDVNGDDNDASGSDSGSSDSG